MGKLFDRLKWKSKLLCMIRGHRGSHIHLYNEDETYLYYEEGCAFCTKIRYHFKVRKDDPGKDDVVSAHSLYGAGYYGGIYLGDGRH